MALTSTGTLTRARERQIGPIGTASRALVGVVLIAFPVALEGIGWWDVAAVMVALPLITLALAEIVAAFYRRFASESLRRPYAICSGPACLLGAAVIAAAIALAILTPVREVSIWNFLGLSMVVAALRGYGGCELLSIPNLVTGRDEQIGCLLFTPIDRAEKSRVQRGEK